VASVIAGAMSSEQARSNAAATGWELSDAELAEVDSILTRPS
jgi:aryl-alcohol dehydrogenase-like predicted oxidoreductase